MLHRGFKSAKCKTSLKLATSRIKLMRNKKEAQLKQMKRDLAQLLESGQDQTARIRVEHVVREQKMMAAYDLLGIYCELIVARLPMIESQKNCPIDLKEAVASVIFASPRCADIPELMDARKHFTAKYGKEFVSAAVELRPNCGVSRTLIEKLSVTAPDGPTKIKILTAIAEEHNITWEHKSFGEKDSKPPDDLLNGPNTFEKASTMHAEPPNVQSPHSHEQKRDPPIKSFEQNLRSSLSSQQFTSTDIGGTKPHMPTTYDSPEVRPSGSRAERPEFRQSFPRDTNAYRQNWDMEFKDATSAAQAAAESAERASMAARAAAELSSRGNITRQYSTESQKSNVHDTRNGGPGTYAPPKSPREHFAKDFVSNSYERNSKLQDEQIDRNEHDSRSSSRKSSRSASSRSSTSSIDGGDTMVNSIEKGYSQTRLSEEKAVKSSEGVLFGKSMKKQSGESEVEVVKGRQYGSKSHNSDSSVGERIVKQSSTVSSRSHSRSSNGDEDPYVRVNKGNIYRDTVKRSSHDENPIVFDKYGSDDDDHKFDTGAKYDEQESNLYSPSPRRKSPSHVSPHSDSRNRKQSTIGSSGKSSSQSLFSTERRPSPEFTQSSSKFANPSKSDNSSSVTYDHSDGPNSESEDEPDKSRRGGTIDSRTSRQKRNVHTSNTEPKYVVDTVNNTPEPSETLKDKELLKQGSFESGNQLNLGILPSRHRNKGYINPPYIRSPSGDSSSASTKVTEDISSTIEQPKALSPVKRSSSSVKSSPRAPIKRSDSSSESDSDSDSDEEIPRRTLSSKRDPYSRIAVKGTNTKSSSRAHDDDSEEDVPKLNLSSGSRSGSGFSQRTKTSPSSSTTSSYSKVTAGSNTSGNSEFGAKKIHSRTSYGTETPSKPEFPSSGSNTSGNSEFGAKKIHSRTSYGTEMPSNPEFSSSGSNTSGNSEFGAKKIHSRTSYSTETPSRPEFPSSGSNTSANSEFDTRTNHSRTSYGTETPCKHESTSSGLNTSGNYEIGPKTNHSRTSYGAETPRKPKSTSSGSHPSGNSEFGPKKHHSRASYDTETPSKFDPPTSSSGYWGGYEQSSSTELAASKSSLESKVSLSKDKPKSPATEKTPRSPREQVTSSRTESPKAWTSSGQVPSGENSLKKASHVHPKLPDYDTIAAQFQSMRLNRQ